MVSTKPHTECFGCAEQSGVGGLLGLQGIEGLFFFLTPTGLTCGMEAVCWDLLWEMPSAPRLA